MQPKPVSFVYFNSISIFSPADMAKMKREGGGGDQTGTKKQPIAYSMTGLLALAAIGIVAWIAVVSAIATGASLRLQGQQRQMEKVKVLESRIHELEVQASMTDYASDDATVNIEFKNEEGFVTFAAQREGDIKSGELTFNETLFSVPTHAFSKDAGTFLAPLSGHYFFSFSGTSFCGENRVEAIVNSENKLKFYDQDVTWVGGPENATAFAYFRGWTEHFALKLVVGDTVRLLVDCDNTDSDSAWIHHKPGAVQIHHGHTCFHKNFYFFGQLIG